MYLHKNYYRQRNLKKSRKIYQDVIYCIKKYGSWSAGMKARKGIFYIGLNMMLIRISNIFIYLRRIRFHLGKT